MSDDYRTLYENAVKALDARNTRIAALEEVVVELVRRASCPDLHDDRTRSQFMLACAVKDAEKLLPHIYAPETK